MLEAGDGLIEELSAPDFRVGVQENQHLVVKSGEEPVEDRPVSLQRRLDLVRTEPIGDLLQ
jgi:hypothetical protein